jgi:hypothetical protein
MVMGGWPVDEKNIGFGGALLMSDSSDSDEDRSGMSGGGSSAAWSDNEEAWGGFAAASRKALGWSAEAVFIDLRFLAEEEGGVVVEVVGCSVERVYVRSLRAGRAQAFGATTIGARS